MKLKNKIYFRLNLMSLFFIITSFISVTLAWFAYSGLANVATEIGVKAWYIELDKNGEVVSSDIVISLSDIYPGMETVEETININNLGDSNAAVKYEIVSARILGNEEDNFIVDGEIIKSDYVENILATEYPFHIDMILDKDHVLAKGEPATFKISISWPFDSDDDETDTFWGTEAYRFQQTENDKKIEDPDYQIKPSIGIVINLTAEQYLSEE